MENNLPISVLVSKMEVNERKMVIMDSRMRALVEENYEHAGAIKAAITSGNESFGDKWKDLLFLWTGDHNFPALWFFKKLQSCFEESKNDFLLIEVTSVEESNFLQGDGSLKKRGGFQWTRSIRNLLLLDRDSLFVDVSNQIFGFRTKLGGKVKNTDEPESLSQIVFSSLDCSSLFLTAQKPEKNKLYFDRLNDSGFRTEFFFGSKRIIKFLLCIQESYEIMGKFSEHLSLNIDVGAKKITTGTLSLL